MVQGLLTIVLPRRRQFFPEGQSEWLSAQVQDWQRARALILGLGYNEKRGGAGLLEDGYRWEDGVVESFETVLNRVNWLKDDYIAKTILYSWARNAAATQTWQPNLIEPVDPVQLRNYQEAHHTWNQIVQFFNYTTYQYYGHPELLSSDSPDFSLVNLTHARMRLHRQMIKSCLIDRP
ncbi:hypothetical protein C8R42DRAFT_715178 [Lentinula raphanica]|nr:hypothetical protein C8R42DRAFT_715178 [Lentinula raphanica]